MGGGKKDDQGDTKNLQDGPPRVALENGPNQDCACGTRLMPRLEGFVQFYLRTWMHSTGEKTILYIREASGVVQQLWDNVFW